MIRRKRKVIEQRSSADWEELIKVCLHNSAHTDNWGCLNKKGELFRICTLRKIKVPDSVISNLETRGILKLNTALGQNDMYAYTLITRRKKRKLFVDR